MTDHSLLLKIFSGPHVGGEMLLRDGEYVIGGDESCDVILNDQFIAARHARLQISGAAVKCVSLEGGKVFVDGRPIEQASIEHFQYFTLGNTHLAIGPADEKWPVREFPEFRLDVPTEDPAPTAEEGVSETDHSETDDEQPHEPPQRRKRPWAWAAILAVFFLGNTLAGCLIVGPGFFAVEATEDDSADKLQRLQAVIESYQTKAALEFAATDNGYQVTGFTMNDEDRRRLENELKTMESRIEFRVWDTSQLADSVRDVVAAQKLADALQVSALRPGEVEVSGKLRDRKLWQTAQQRIHNDVRVLKKLVSNVEIIEPTPPPKPQPPAPVVAAAPTIQLDLRGVHAGDELRWITLGSGERIFEGGRLANGYTVRKIDVEQLVLSRNGRETTFRLGD